ncbi:unnamed protein product [Lymnaea stagnalis]|uniref:Uncharacterized protein n=1 Tax=Lymnaea stagnalis TaxID=6523 RepID=A0AAV2HJH1_LYMST
MAAARQMGSTAEEQSAKLQQILHTLEKSTPQPRESKESPVKGKESKLKYIQLLDPETRTNRWMHTTWHHLPEYKDDNPVNNWSSHYTRPHAPTPRHYVIHPDWS